MKMFKRITALVLSLLLLDSGSFTTAAEALSLTNMTCRFCGQTGTHAEDCKVADLTKIAGFVKNKIQEKIDGDQGEETTGPTGESTESTDPSAETVEAAVPTEESTVPAEPSEPAEPTACEKLLAAGSTEEMYLLMLDMMNNTPEQLMALTVGEIEQIRARVNTLDPGGDDADTRDILDTLAVLPNGGGELAGDPAVLPASATIGSNQDWLAGGVLTEDTEWIFQNGAAVTFKGPITIPGGRTLTLKGWGSVARFSTNAEQLFIVESGGRLIIEGTSETYPITIDGKNVIANTPLISASGTLSFRNAVIQNGKNRSVYPADHKNAGKPNGQGGGIALGKTGSLTMDHCVVTRNTASLNGGGIYSAGPVTIRNSEISWNRAASAETSYSNVNAGRGGGFALAGENADGILENVRITRNAAMYYGGGGQVSGTGSSLVMNGNTVFSYNEAILHGAGALHLTGDASFTMNGGVMEHNTAQYCGGAIHSSYSCVLNLNRGTIKNNTTYGRGGGIHINTGGAITLNSGITITGNKVFNKPIGSYAELDAAGDVWSNVKYEGHNNDFGYGGGVLIDSGTCTVAGATITGNYAKVGGGGIALTMLNMNDGGLDDLMIINFAMTSGTVSENTTDGDGAGVYIMSNKAKENIIRAYGAEGTEEYNKAVAKIEDTNKYYETADEILNGIPEAVISGGAICNNTAQNNGGGLYLGEKTHFEIRGTGEISGNRAVDGAGVYVAMGTADINGGGIHGNAASNDGGALYIRGAVNMTAGSVHENVAVNGGGVYVKDGNMMIHQGNLDKNTANRGGAVYMDGTADTTLTMESGTMNENKATDNAATTDEVEGDGGAVFATSGTIIIGLEDCKTENEAAFHNCAHHAALGEERHHPRILHNEAADTGGGIAIANEGTVRFYCGTANDNTALYKGVGKNIFMDGGDFHLYDGANVGIPRDPDLVIVGGNLHNECTDKKYISLNYYYRNTDTQTSMVGLAEYEEIMNLPDGEYFWDAPEGCIFLGWTAQGAASGTASNEYVRHKEQYLASGLPVEILDHESEETDETGSNTDRMWDGTSDEVIHLYALWAPRTSSIEYIDGLTNQKITSSPETYEFQYGSNHIRIMPVLKPGYDLVGWYIYQNDNQNANWNDTKAEYDSNLYEPRQSGAYTEQKKYLKLDQRNGTFELEAGCSNFGDITLIAHYVPAFTDLRIMKSGCSDLDENQVFQFRVEGTPSDPSLTKIDMVVTIQGNGFVQLRKLPVGDYSVTEWIGWSWRYETADAQKDIHLDKSDMDYVLSFHNSRKQSYWLSADSYAENWWGGTGGTVVRREEERS